MERIIKISTDYLVVGAGAMGLAFADEVINMSNGTGNDNTEILIVDRRAQPGGHWNDAYDFVRLHQPSFHYGVSSMNLGSGNKDLCSKFQLLAYFELALKKMVATGRVKFLGQCEFKDGNVRSLLDENVVYEIEVRRKTVDATYLNTSIPSTHPPKYKFEEGVMVVPINHLVKVSQSWEKFVIVGAGKTGIDAILYLLDMNVSADRIIWIMPNDSWLWNREYIYLESTMEYIKGILDDIQEADTLKDLLKKQESRGIFFRLDTTKWPTKYKCATVSPEEFEKLKEVKNIVRQGRVAEITKEKIIFQNGSSFPVDGRSLYVDCSSDGLAAKPACPIFQGKKIVLQSVSMCQQVFSASAIAALEMRMEDKDDKKNAILEPVPHPEHTNDYIRCVIVTDANQKRNSKDGVGFRWYRNNRLNIVYHLTTLQLFKLGYLDYMKPMADKLKRIQEKIEAGQN